MTINPELLPHASYGELLDGGAEELKQKIESLDFMPVMFKPQTVFALVSVMQLALRHPAMGILESPHEAAERFIDAAREYFADCPHVLEMIRRGDRAYDV
jgi:hypothetical protein